MSNLLRFPPERQRRRTEKVSRWKVPFRNVYCDTFGGWWRQTIWCHFVLRVFPHVHDFGSDALTELYIHDPFEMHAQLQFLLYEVRDRRRREQTGARPPEPRPA